MMPYQPTSGNLILRGVLALGPLVAELDQSSRMDRADHLEGAQGGQGPHSTAARFLFREQVFDRFMQMQRVFDDVFALHDMMYMDCTDIFLIYICTDDMIG